MLKAVEATMEAAAAGDEDRFLALATDFTRRYPREEFGHEQRAQALYAKGCHAEAISELHRAMELGFDEWQGRLALGEVMSDAEDYGAALQEFTRVLDNSSYRAQGFMGRAMCLAALGDLDQALKDADEAVAALPGEESYQVRAIVHRLRDDGHKALADINRVVQLRPGHPDHLLFRAFLLDEAGNAHAAQEDRDRARAIAEPAPVGATADAPEGQNAETPADQPRGPARIREGDHWHCDAGQ